MGDTFASHDTHLSFYFSFLYVVCWLLSREPQLLFATICAPHSRLPHLSRVSSDSNHVLDCSWLSSVSSISTLPCYCQKWMFPFVLFSSKLDAHSQFRPVSIPSRKISACPWRNSEFLFTENILLLSRCLLEVVPENLTSLVFIEQNTRASIISPRSHWYRSLRIAVSVVARNEVHLVDISFHRCSMAKA